MGKLLPPLFTFLLLPDINFPEVPTSLKEEEEGISSRDVVCTPFFFVLLMNIRSALSSFYLQ